MHFYHQENLLFNPPERFCTNTEIEFPVVLPKKMSPLPPTSVVDSSDQDKADDTPCWTVMMENWFFRITISQIFLV
jgi:hypothetical protein